MTPHHKLHSLLTRLGAVPDGMIHSPYRGPDMRLHGLQWRSGWMYLSDGDALAILCDKARRVCDEHNVDINAPEGNFGWHGVNGWEDSESGYDDYESALIAGLEYLIEQKGLNDDR